MSEKIKKKIGIYKEIFKSLFFLMTLAGVLVYFRNYLYCMVGNSFSSVMALYDRLNRGVKR